jgi:hypothetical protein
VKEVFLIVVAGAILFAAFFAVVWLKSKQDKNSPTGRLAEKYGWVYEGGREWSCVVPGKYLWRGRETAVDGKRDGRMLEFKARIPNSAAINLLVGAIGDTHGFDDARRTNTGNVDFDRLLSVTTNAPQLVAPILEPDALNAWLQWPQARPTDLSLSLADGWLHIRLPTRGFLSTDEPEKFLLFCESFVKRIEHAANTAKRDRR